MFQTALVTSDLSEASDRLIASLDMIKDLGVKKVLLVHALGLDEAMAEEDELAGFVKSRLETQLARVRGIGFEASLLIVPGVPFREILRIANEQSVSLLVMGSHGAGLASEILLGSVTQRVLRRAVIPVLVIRTDVPPAKKNTILKRILHPTDFSDNAERAFSCLEKLVSYDTEQVILLHADENVCEECSDLLNELDSRLRTLGVRDVRIVVENGNPMKSILSHASDDNCTLMVMGSQGRGFVSEIFIGSVSFNVVRNAVIPVLLIPAARQ